jgi:hypothetical protein
MLNPDGVVVGNYRCSLAGRDLNRRYKTSLREAFPSIWHTRRQIERILNDHEISFYIDLHGHSRKHNVFMYGCQARLFNPLRHQRHFSGSTLNPYYRKSVSACDYVIL